MLAVSDLFIYPIKSLAGISIQQGVVTYVVLKMIVDGCWSMAITDS